MKTEELVPENVGRAVLLDSLNGFNNARATMRAWEKNLKTIIVSLDSDYGRERQTVECGYCSGTGEVAESSTRYMKCPACTGSGRRATRGKLLTKGMLVEVSIENVRFANSDSH